MKHNKLVTFVIGAEENIARILIFLLGMLALAFSAYLAIVAFAVHGKTVISGTAPALTTEVTAAPEKEVILLFAGVGIVFILVAALWDKISKLSAGGITLELLNSAIEAKAAAATDGDKTAAKAVANQAKADLVTKVPLKTLTSQRALSKLISGGGLDDIVANAKYTVER